VTGAWHSYPKVWNLGHPRTEGIMDTEYIVQEKYDGSQFSWQLHEGEVRYRSRNVVFTKDDPSDMFKLGVNYIEAVKDQLIEGWVYRGEFFSKPKHNTLAYDRVPRGNIVLFDIELDYNVFQPPVETQGYAMELGVDSASFIVRNNVPLTLEEFKGYLERESTLGGVKVEGVVIKNYTNFTPEGHVQMAKFVSEAFKEAHKSNPNFKRGHGPIVEALGSPLRTEARFRKSVERLRDAGGLTNSAKDIGPLLKDLSDDLDEEHAEVLAKELYSYFRKDILKHANYGFPQWYKEELAKRVLETE
jgi:hypothetical protein